MITKLAVQNFKSWGNTGEVRLAPITGFFGSNSSIIGGHNTYFCRLIMRKNKQIATDPSIMDPGMERAIDKLLKRETTRSGR